MKRRLDAVAKELDAELQQHASIIAERVQKGQTFNARRIRPGYSKKYKQKRINAGYSGRVNLTITGGMMRAMSTKVVRKGESIIGTIFFRNTSSISPQRFYDASTSPKRKSVKKREKRGGPKPVRDRVKALAHQRRYNFFGLSRSQLRKMLEKIRAKLNGI